MQVLSSKNYAVTIQPNV
jgi:hypothetical protein